ncbi:MAG: hypothetical protein ABR610_05325 [Thermoanaerobaculia bacterium]
MPRVTEIRIDGPVLIFTLALSLGTGIGLGLIPAVSRQRDLVTSLHEGGERASAGGGRHRGATS